MIKICGIVGIYNLEHAPRKVIDLIVKQEGRGRDATGIAYVRKDNFFGLIKKSVAPSRYKDVFEKRLASIDSTIAIGHNRAATCNHKEKEMDKEAHPFPSEDGTFCLLHNGFYRDHESFRRMMTNLYGHRFSSGVDSEVMVHVLEDCLLRSKTRLDAFKKFYPYSQGNVLVLFSDGEMVGIPEGAFYLVVADSTIMIASEKSTLRFIIEDKSIRNISCYKITGTGYNSTGAVVSIKMVDNVPKITFVGDWTKATIRTSTWVKDNECQCDYCRKTKPTMRVSDFRSGYGKDKCKECWDSKAVEPVRVREPYRHSGTRNFNRHTNRGRRSSVKKTYDEERLKQVQCLCNGECNDWFSFDQVIICPICMRPMCLNCYKSKEHLCLTEQQRNNKTIEWFIPRGKDGYSTMCSS